MFLQDGRNDNRGVGRGGAYDQRRDWFYQNVRMMQALTEKGYDLNYTWGMNTHGQRMGGPMLPEMMRWLWRDHRCRPIRTTRSSGRSTSRSRRAQLKLRPASLRPASYHCPCAAALCASSSPPPLRWIRHGQLRRKRSIAVSSRS